MAETQTPPKTEQGKGNRRKVTVAHRAFPYRVEIPHPYEPDGTMVNDRMAHRGDEIEVLPYEYERGMKLGSFLKEGQTLDEATGQSRPLFSAVDATDTELINWIKEEQPSANEVIEASEGDPETAQRLLTAESAATGNDPRKDTVAGLEEVIRRGAE